MAVWRYAGVLDSLSNYIAKIARRDVGLTPRQGQISEIFMPIMLDPSSTHCRPTRILGLKCARIPHHAQPTTRICPIYELPNASVNSPFTSSTLTIPLDCHRWPVEPHFHMDFVAFTISFGAVSPVYRQFAANEFVEARSDMQHHVSGQTLLPHRDVASFQVYTENGL